MDGVEVDADVLPEVEGADLVDGGEDAEGVGEEGLDGGVCGVEGVVAAFGAGGVGAVVVDEFAGAGGGFAEFEAAVGDVEVGVDLVDVAAGACAELDAGGEGAGAVGEACLEFDVSHGVDGAGGVGGWEGDLRWWSVARWGSVLQLG